MAAIYPVSSSRVSDNLLRSRLLQQFDNDRIDLLRIQDQLSTGLRIQKPSDDAPAAMRAIGLQRLIEQNERTRLNLDTSQSYVSAADSALIGASEHIANVRAEALGAVDSTTSPAQREITLQEIRTTINELLTTGNHRFRGRYLFSGSTTNVQPFEHVGPYIAYEGNQGDLSSYVDTDFLSGTNVDGDQVFGGISAAKTGSVDLNPVLKLNTRLSDLHGGLGINKGSFVVSDGNSNATINLESAETIGDVVRLLEANPPTGRSLIVRLGQHGLEIDMDDAGSGSLSIYDVPGGTTAAELGIRELTGVGTTPLIGRDLDPRLRVTTPLNDLLGSRAGAVLVSGGGNNDLFIEAVNNGDEFNDVTVRFTSGAAAGDQALVTYDSIAKSLEIDISPGTTRAATVQAAINNSGLFTATFDQKLESDNDGAGAVDSTATATTSGGTGTNLDLASGLQIVNGDQTHTLTFENVETVQDLLNTLNASDAYVLARINPQGDGIDIQSRLSGSDFQIGENGGILAEQLGLRTLTAETRLEDLDYARGVDVADGTDFVIHRKDGVAFEVDVSAAETIGDVIELINQHADNNGNSVVARLAAFGNGIELYDENEAGGNQVRVERALSFAAWGLGLIPQGEDQQVAQAATAATASLDFAPPNHRDTALDLTANQVGFAMNDASIHFLDTRVGDVADSVFDVATNTLTVHIDPTQTTANTVLNAITAEGTFSATLDTSSDSTNDGSGVVGTTGLIAITADGSAESLQGADVNPHETEGIFNSLLRLSAAIEDFDLPKIERAATMLDDDFQRLSFARAELGARGRAFDSIQRRVQDEEVELRASLSLEIDADVVQAISELSARQASLEASLRLAGGLMQTSLMDFL